MWKKTLRVCLQSLTRVEARRYFPVWSLRSHDSVGQTMKQRWIEYPIAILLRCQAFLQSRIDDCVNNRVIDAKNLH